MSAAKPRLLPDRVGVFLGKGEFVPVDRVEPCDLVQSADLTAEKTALLCALKLSVGAGAPRGEKLFGNGYL